MYNEIIWQSRLDIYALAGVYGADSSDVAAYCVFDIDIDLVRGLARDFLESGLVAAKVCWITIVGLAFWY